MQQQAKLTKVDQQLVIQCPYNSRLVDRIRGIPGRRWDNVNRVWSVPVESEQQVRDLVRQFFKIEDEPDHIERIVIRVKVTGKSPGGGRNLGGVMIEDRDIFDTSSGYLDMRPNNDYEILDYVGGIVGDIPDPRDPFAVEYTLRLKVRKNAKWYVSGYGEFRGDYEILSGDNPVDRFLEELLNKDAQ